jgi:UDP-N-acetyl-D-glucosamine dehydrogenase
METLGVMGLGYVGLPLAVQAAEKGYTVTGFELNTELIDKVNTRVSPYVNDPRFETALKNIDHEYLHATSDFNELRQVETIIICVPTPTENNTPDLTLVENAARQIGKMLRRDQLIVLESTVNPGVTRDLVLPILEKESGLKVGIDFFLAHCPERIDPGNEKFFVGNLNRVVGGITEACTERALNFYLSIIDAKITPLGSTEEAEFVKSWENSHRNIMIAMANSAAIISDALGMNIDNILEGLQSKVDQFGLKLATPGIGPGGHCIPEDIHYVIKKARENGIDTRFLDDAAELNDKMPQYAVHKLSMIVKENGENLKDLNIALLGLAYKPNIDDIRRSPSIEVGYQLVRKAKSVSISDPYVNMNRILVKGALVAHTLEEALESADAIFIGTAHNQYKELLTAELLSRHNIRYVFDGRNCLNKEAIVEAGIKYRGIGK